MTPIASRVTLRRLALTLTALATSLDSSAASVLPGPTGTVAFGTKVSLVQTGGNFAVVDPQAGSGAGAVYLYTAAGALLSTLTGAAPGDHVGSGGIVVLANGRFLVSSPDWANSGAAGAGAVTLIDGGTGLSGAVSPANSLVGSSAGDHIGSAPFVDGITPLANGNVVVVSPGWSDGASAGVGAVTWMNGTSGLTGAVSAANSLIGSVAQDAVGSGGATALSNGNYVVSSDLWHGTVGAVTWVDGSAGTHAKVSTANSLVGSHAGDSVGGGYEQGLGGFGQPGQRFRVGGVLALGNGNYVVQSPHWANGAATLAGAATWCSGTAACVGAVSAANSLVGSNAADVVGFDATALTDGNYVVRSSGSNPATPYRGAATWGDGSKGISGTVTLENSLVGLHDSSGGSDVIALSNGNYVVCSPEWGSTDAGDIGAVTWGDGTRGVTGLISSANSFLGTRGGDFLCFGGIVPLRNGNYVIDSYEYNNLNATAAGAVTWADGSKPLLGTISADNSLIGDQAEDSVGIGQGVVALANGDYVVASSSWHGFRGAVTWGSGSTGVSGVVSASNSLVGASSADMLGSGGVTALTNGNYVILSDWKNGDAEFTGAATFVDAGGTKTGTFAISSTNSLVGAHALDGIGGAQVLPAADGNYAVYFPAATGPSGKTAGAAALVSGTHGFSGVLNGSIATYGTNTGTRFSFDYDATHRQLIVGKGADDAVALLRLAGPAITAGGYLSGNWYDTAQPGHGFQLEFATDNTLVAIWFVYTPDGSGQNWIYAQGSYDPTSDSVTVPAVLLEHARFPPNFLASDVQRLDWGSLTFAFADCNNATVTWNSTLPAYGVGSLPLTRLTQIAGTTCPP